MRTIEVCPGTLAPGFDTYSPSCLRKVFLLTTIGNNAQVYLSNIKTP